MSDAGRQSAAEAAAALAEPGMRLGLGTGRTVDYVLHALARRIRDDGLRLVGIPTSEATAARARALAFPLAAPDAPCDLAIDGADQVERTTLRLLKGGGGALLREKIVAESAARFVVVAEAPKLVDHLGQGFPLPVEITPYAYTLTAARVAAIGGAPRLRAGTTDNANLILDCPGFAPIRDPFTLERQLRAIPGVVATGLFLTPPERVILGHDDGTTTELLP